MKNESSEVLIPPDGGWGWLILFAATLVNVIISGVVKSFGILVVEFVKEYESTELVVWIAAVAYFLYSFLGPLSSVISVKYSYRVVTIIGGTLSAIGMILCYFTNKLWQLLLCYGVLVGAGAGLCFPATVYIVNSYFVRRRGLANGLCISGSAMGSIVIPPLLTYLIYEYTYRGASLIMGAISLNIWTAACIYQDVEKHAIRVTVSDDGETLSTDEMSDLEVIEAGSLSYMSTLHHGAALANPATDEFAEDVRRMSEKKSNKMTILKKYIDINLFCDPIYLVILVSNATSAISYTNFIIMLPMYMSSLEMSESDAPYLISVLSFFDLIGRFAASTMADYNIISTAYYFVGGLFVSGVGLAFVGLGKTFVLIAIPAAVMGIAAGTVVGVTALVMADFLGTDKLTSSYGISLFVNGILQLMGPPICAALVETSTDYEYLFVALGMILIFGSFVWVVMPCILKYKKNEANKN